MSGKTFLFYLDCLISLFTWKILKKTGQKITTYTLPENQQFTVRKYSMDCVVLYENLIEKVYDMYIPMLNKGDFVVDVGAHIGSFSIHLAQKFPNVRIIGLEPMSENFSLLKKNIELNHVEKSIRILPIGVAKKSEKRILYKDSGNSAGHTLYSTSKKFASTIQCTTLQNLLNKYKISTCKLLKLDCEGAEYEILLNCPRAVLSKIENIIAELHDQNQTPALLKKLEAYGFHCQIVRGLQNPLFNKIFNVPLFVASRIRN